MIARSFGIGAGVVITGTLFGLLHAPQLWGGWGQICFLIVVGIIFTYVRAISRTVRRQLHAPRQLQFLHFHRISCRISRAPPLPPVHKSL